MSKIKEGSLVILHIRDVWSSNLKRTLKRGETGIVIEVCEVNDMFVSSMFRHKDKMFRIMFSDGVAAIFSDWVRLLKINKTPKSDRNLKKYLQKKAGEFGKN